MKRGLFLALSVAIVSSACSTAPDEASPGASTAQSVASGTPSVAPSPSPGEPLRVAVKGDWGASSAAQRAVTEAMCVLREREPFRTVVTTGDNFYDPDGQATPSNFDRPEACLVADPGHRWRATWGNHDVRAHDTGVKLGAARWYTWSEAGADFFMLDSNQAGSRQQRAWLERELKASSASIKIAVFHHPPYSAGDFRIDDETVKDRWVPLFERYDVTLVLSGHQHTYEHWRVRGVDYVITGGGGQRLYRCERKASALERCAAEHHFVVVESSEDGLRVRAIRTDGSVLDRFSIAA